MQLNYRLKPYSVLTFEALFRRLKPKHRTNDTLNGRFAAESAGYSGEKNVDYKLSLYPHNGSIVIQGPRLKNGAHPFQIDTLILTQNFFCILEIKNIKGELEYDSDFQQWMQKVGDEIKGYKNPIYQAEAQKRHLEALLNGMGIHNVPIEYLVVISNPSTILRNSQGDQEVFDKIIHTESLPIYLDKMVNKYKTEAISRDTMKKVNNYIMKNQTPLQPQLIKNYNLKEHHFIKGVTCPNCQHNPMIRSKRTWLCQQCSTTDKNAHKQTILDYFLLHKPTITNRECKELLQLDSARVAYNLLKSMDLKYSGKTRGRYYFSPRIEDFPQDSFAITQEKRSILFD